MVISSFSQAYPPKSKFTEADIPDLTGKVAIVTGGNTGLGKETARALLQHNCRVYLACRSPTKAQTAINELKTLTGRTEEHIKFLQLDLGSIKASRDAAMEFMKEETKLHLLINNAGVMMTPKGSLTDDGYEIQWGTNVLGHYIFTETLIPLLRQTASHSDPAAVRIVNVSSSFHAFAPKGGFAFDDPTGTKTSKSQLYGQSKLGNIFLSNYWAQKLARDGIVSLSLNPGNIQTDLHRFYATGIIRWIMDLIALQPIKLGVLTQLFAATSPSITPKDNGGYLVPWCRRDSLVRKEVNDPEVVKKFLELVEKQCKEKL